MHRLVHRIAAIVLGLAFVGGCGTGPRAGTSAEQETFVRVTNQNFLDMNIYVLRSEERIRLGTVRGNQTERFRLPRNLVLGTTALRFMADPIGSTRTSQSFEIAVAPGDEVSLTIPPGGDVFNAESKETVT